MNNIKISDLTLCLVSSDLTFKEKIEIARQLEKLQLDCIELPEIKKVKSDTLFIRTVSSFLKNSILSVCAGSSIESIDNAVTALSVCKKPMIRIELPVSTVRMEYDFHKKAPKMLEWINKTVCYASQKCDVEFCALDATRAESEFLIEALKTAESAGAKIITVCDDAGEMLTDEFTEFIKRIKSNISTPIYINCNNKNGMALSLAAISIKNGDAQGVKTSVNGDTVSLENISTFIRNCGEKHSIISNIRYTELYRTISQIKRITGNVTESNEKTVSTVTSNDEIKLDKNDDKNTVITMVARLGYDLSKEDEDNVYEQFLRVADKKTVGAKELDAIVISSALQVPPTYKLDNYIVNSGNSISSSAQVTLKHFDSVTQGISIGDGPIDAAFLAIEQIIGCHYDLEDFQIQTVTEGKEAIGSAIIKLRSAGKIYSGNGISTDIIEASIRAYLNALNKIAYEEV
ncbi:MAG: hypothetical protein MJ076_00225 [Clostridia bacterium]|nr:hypothetical protein [Clostridia bacterium]